MKSKCFVSGCYKQKNKVCLGYLEGTLQQYRYGLSIFKLKGMKTVEKIYFETKEQQTRYR